MGAKQKPFAWMVVILATSWWALSSETRAQEPSAPPPGLEELADELRQDALASWGEEWPEPIATVSQWKSPGGTFSLTFPSGWSLWLDEPSTEMGLQSGRQFLFATTEPAYGSFQCDVFAGTIPFTLGRTQQDLNQSSALMLDQYTEGMFAGAPHDLLRYEIVQSQGVDIGVYEGMSEHPDADVTWVRTAVLATLQPASIEIGILECRLVTFAMEAIAPMNAILDSLAIITVPTDTSAP